MDVIDFTCEDGLVYETWGKELVDCIIAGAQLDAEVIQTTNKKNETVNRVVQIYDSSGKPLKAQAKKQFSSGAQGPEARRSNETQKAAELTNAAWIAGKLQDSDPLISKLRKWLDPRLDIPVPKVFEQPAPTTTTSAAGTPPAKKVETPPTTKPGKTPDDIVAEDVPDLNAVFRVCFNFWPDMLSQKIAKELGHLSLADAHEAYKGKSGWAPFLTIKNIKQPEEPPEEPAASQEERLTEEEELEQAPFLK
ncbi:hypothetical protein ES703_57080 [subsurface metagenome]